MKITNQASDRNKNPCNGNVGSPTSITKVERLAKIRNQQARAHGTKNNKCLKRTTEETNNNENNKTSENNKSTSMRDKNKRKKKSVKIDKGRGVQI